MAFRWPFRGWRLGEGLMLGIAACLAALLSYLISENYAAASRHHAMLTGQAEREAILHAQALADFTAGQAETLGELAAAPDVVAFFENRALGMSQEYGLRQSLLLIAERFTQLRERKRQHGATVFERIVFHDADGATLCASPPGNLATAAEGGQGISLAKDGSALLLGMPVKHRSRLAGNIVARIPLAVVKQAATLDREDSHSTHLLTADRPPHLLISPPDSALAVLPTTASAEPQRLTGTTADGRVLVIAVPVPGLPLILATQQPAPHYLGSQPWHALLAMVLISVLLVGGAVILVLQMVRARKLGEMVTDMRVREAAEAERNRLAIEREVSARTRAEDERTQLGHAVEQAAESILITDLDGRIEYVNPAFTAITGWQREEVVGQTPRLLRSGLHDATFYGAIWRQLGDGRPWHGRLANRRRDGSIVQMDATISPVRDAHGRICRYLSVAADVSELLRMEEQLRQAQKLESIGQLAAGIAHEINTPIQFIGDNLRFLRDSFAGLLTAATPASAPDADLDYLRTEIPKALAESQDGVARVAQIVLAMKEFSHPGGHDRAPADLNRCVQSTITVSRNTWRYVAELSADLAPDLPQVPLLVGDFNQTVLNLIVNAAHAIEDRQRRRGGGMGRIAITTRLVDGMAELRVADDGCGIPDEIRRRIFEPFFTTKEVGRGTGQGLTLAHTVVVKKHGGTISFDSRTGEGTTFIVRLPLTTG